MYLQQTGTNAIVADSSGSQALNDTTPNLQLHPAYLTGLFTIVAALPTPYFLLNFSSPIQTAQPFTPPALSKGSQSGIGITTQDLKDSGRTFISFYATAVAAGLTGVEGMMTLNRFKSGTGITSANSFVLTAGKYFRITQIIFATRGHLTATAQVTTFSLRVNGSGAVTTGSTSIMSLRCATPATANAWDRVSLTIPDGIEVIGDGAIQIGISANSVYATNAPTGDCLIIGFEY